MTNILDPKSMKPYDFRYNERLFFLDIFCVNPSLAETLAETLEETGMEPTFVKLFN